jgi:acyl dehydratase
LEPDSGHLNRRRYTRSNLEPTSFDDLALGGEWTTRRRTISESEIALFAALAGDFSPLAVDTSGGNTRLAPPALLVAMAVGLGSMDMPIPQVAAWEWVNWKFPKAVKAGETIYARWTLTQKRSPVHGAAVAIAVWRVDVHTADGVVCAEGEIGASVFRKSAPHPERVTEPVTAGAPAARRRRRRRSPTSATTSEPPAPAVPASQAAERTGSPRRRRRRRPAGSSTGNGDSAPAAPPAEPSAPAAPILVSPPAAAPAGAAANPISRVMRRLRRP